MKIKIKEITQGCFPVEFEVGDWYDLVLAEEVKLRAPNAKTLHRINRSKEEVPEERFREVIFDSKLLPLGVAMELPEGYEAIIAPRSSTFKKYGLLQTNSIGVIDNSYSSDKDEWKMAVVSTRRVTIPKGTRVAQFRIQLSQKASPIQKLKWLCSSSPELVKVESLGNKERGGFGSTDNK